MSNGKSLQTPGPGNYRLPSDFGYYESKKKEANNTGFRTAGPGMGRSASQPALNGTNKDTL